MSLTLRGSGRAGWRQLPLPVVSSVLLALALGVVPAVVADGETLTAAFTDPRWDGITVPDGAQCQKFGGSEGSPALRVSAIPAAATALVIEYSDRSYGPMDKGGHGKLGYVIAPGTGETLVPSAPPHTMALPDGFWTVAEHGAPGWDKAGAYLPPCSGGKGNAYYLTVRAVVRNDDGSPGEELASTMLEMGRY